MPGLGANRLLRDHGSLSLGDQRLELFALLQPLETGLGPQLVQNALDSLAGLRTHRKPVQRPVFLDGHGDRFGARIVEPDHLDVTPVARAARIGHDDTVAWLFFTSNATQTNPNHGCSPVSST